MEYPILFLDREVKRCSDVDLTSHFGGFGNVLQYQGMAVKFTAEDRFYVGDTRIPNALFEMLQNKDGKRIYLPDEDIETEVKMQALAGPELAPEVFGYVVRGGKTNYCGFAMKRGYHIDPAAYSTAEKIKIALSMQDCVFRLHDKGILHGDIKFTNMLLVSNDATDLNVMLCDFGCAVFLAKATVVMYGTPYYSSPFRCREWVEHRRIPILSVQDDLYALAATIWELFSGTMPFFDEEDDVKTRIASGPGLDANVVPEEAGLRDFVVACWAAAA